MNRKSKIQAGLFFGIGMSIFFIIQGLLRYDHLSVNEVLKSIVTGLILGAMSGALFGWLMGLTANSKTLANATQIEPDPDETILFESPANHFKGLEGVGGKLYLTNRRLVFKSHNFNFSNHRLDITLSQIKKIDRFKTLGIFNNGILVTTTNDKREKFVVEEAQEWMKRLTVSDRMERV